MKNIFTLLLLCAFLAPQSIAARHIVGGSMGYYFNSDGQLMVEMVIYRDCWGGGSPFDMPVEMAVYKASGELFSAFMVPLDSFQNLELESQSCNNIPFGCIERGTYTFSLSLPDDGNNYLVVHQRCCRTTDLTNLVNPTEVGHTISVEITAEARNLKNNSPRWVTNPRFNTCPHQPVVLNFAASEPDGDTLVYSFCTPLNGGGNIILWPDIFSCLGAKPVPPCPPPFNHVPFAVPNYSFNNPLGSAVSQLNPYNGDWNIAPDYNGKFIYGICIQEYRNGVLLSSTLRDMTLWVKDVVSTSEVNETSTINCSPNPAGDAVYLSTDIFFGETIQIELADLSGKIWLAEKRMNVAPKELLNVGALPTGVYLVKISAKGKTATGRFVHQ